MSSPSWPPPFRPSVNMCTSSVSCAPKISQDSFSLACSESGQGPSDESVRLGGILASTKSRPRISSAPKLLRVAGSVWRWWWFAHRHGAADAHLNLIPCRPNTPSQKLLATTSRRRLCSPMFDRKQSLPVPVRFETTKQLNGFSSAKTKRRAGQVGPSF